MKPFNLERALAGDPVVTREGKRACQFAKFNTLLDKYELVGVTLGGIERWTLEGKYREYGDSKLDLFMAYDEPKIDSLCTAVTRDGRRVEQLTQFDVSGRNLVGRIGDKLHMWYSDGSFSCAEETALDLMLEAQK